jgi:hypothetical protein
MHTQRAGSSTYRYSRVYALRVVGLALLPWAALWVLAGLAGFADWSLWVLAVSGVGVLVLGGWLLGFPPRLLTLSDAGYVVHHVRGNPTPSARWAEVDSATSTQVGGAPGVVIALADGRTSVLPLIPLGVRAMGAQREIHERLNIAHGYRPLEGEL